MRNFESKGFAETSHEDFMDLGKLLGMTPQQAESIANKEILSAYEFARNDLGVDFNAPMGTKYFNNEVPANDLEAMVLTNMAASKPIWELEGVQDREIEDYWNKSMVERAVFNRRANVIRYAAFLWHIQRVPATSIEDAQKMARDFQNRICPGYDMAHPKYFEDSPCHPLPYEVMERVNRFFIAEVMNFGFEGIANRLGDDCFNGYARKLIKAGELG